MSENPELEQLEEILGGGFELQSQKIKQARASGQGANGGRTVFVNPTGGAIRGTDAKGNGHFRASRNNSAGFHKGTDYVSSPGQDVRAVISGRVTKYGWPYGSRPNIRLIDIENSSGYRVRHFYVSMKPGLSVGATVSAGDVIGTAQSLTVFKEFKGMTEHVHVEIYHNGQLVDPATLIR